VYAVVLEEGSSCMGGDEREVDSTHETYEAAVARCRELVDESLERLAAKARTAEELLRTYLAVGPEPFTDPAGDPPFVARRYAEERCRRMFADARQTE
jgi:hypothetical protein